MEWCEDWHEVELWVTFLADANPKGRCLVHWAEDSGGTTGWLRELAGTIRTNARSAAQTSGSDGVVHPFVIEYDLSGRQRGHPVTIRRKLVL